MLLLLDLIHPATVNSRKRKGSNVFGIVSSTLTSHIPARLPASTITPALNQFQFSYITTRSVRLPPRSPNLNCYAERFVRSIKEACLDRMILFTRGVRFPADSQFVNFTVHYHSERNHQGIGNLLIFPANNLTGRAGPVRRSSRLGGMLNYYERAA